MSNDKGGGKRPEVTVAGLTRDELNVLNFLRTPGLRVQNLDESHKELVRAVLKKVHVERGASLSDMAKLIGNKSRGYASSLLEELGIERNTKQ